MGRIALALDGPSARLTLGPGRRVPILDQETLREAGEALTAARRAGVRVLVVAGGRSGTFAAGADLAEIRRLEPIDALRFAARGQRLLDELERGPAVTIAAIRGRCIGGAFDLALACDLRIADAGAVFSHPGPRLGFITGYGGTSRLPAMIGAAAGRVLDGGHALDASSALGLGLLARVAPEADLDRVVGAIVQRLLSASPPRLAVLRQAMRLPAGPRGRLMERRLLALHGMER